MCYHQTTPYPMTAPNALNKVRLVCSSGYSSKADYHPVLQAIKSASATYEPGSKAKSYLFPRKRSRAGLIKPGNEDVDKARRC